MQTYIPSIETLAQWRARAEKESSGARAEFWRALPPLPSRPRDAHKGTFGTTLVVGGSRGMSGAVALAGMTSLVVGSGLARVYAPSAIQETVAQSFLEYCTIGGPCDESGRLKYSCLNDVIAESQRARSVAVGPGLGRSHDLTRLVATLFEELATPALFDADALNALGESWRRSPSRRIAGSRILTPHPGEFERLVGKRSSDSNAEREAAAREFIERLARRTFSDASNSVESPCEATVVLKGWRSVIATSRGDASSFETRVHINLTGNSNLATGGSGDVLTGIISGLIAQGQTTWDAARCGCALHGLAAELRSTLLSRGATARDIVSFLPSAMEYYAWSREAVSF